MEATQALAILVSLTSSGGLPDYSPVVEGEVDVAIMCFAKGEQVSGRNKICYYDCLGDMVAITIKSIQLCPLTIDN